MSTINITEIESRTHHAKAETAIKNQSRVHTHYIGDVVVAYLKIISVCFEVITMKKV